MAQCWSLNKQLDVSVQILLWHLDAEHPLYQSLDHWQPPQHTSVGSMQDLEGNKTRLLKDVINNMYRALQFTIWMLQCGRTVICTVSQWLLLTFFCSPSLLITNPTEWSPFWEMNSQVKKFHAFHGSQRFFTMFTSACHWSLTWARCIQSTTYHPTSLIQRKREIQQCKEKSFLIVTVHTIFHAPSFSLWN